MTDASTKCFQDFVKYTQQQGLQVEVPAVGTVWQLGSATITLLGPVAQYSETNDTSLVLRVDYGSTSFLLTGDMEADAERDLVNSGANLKADVLQVGAPRLQHLDELHLPERGPARNGRHLLRREQQVRPPPRGDP